MAKTSVKSKVAPGRVVKRQIVPRNGKQMLDVLDRFLAQHNDDTADVWNVLAALRGPDDSSDIKDCTTVNIRQTAFPRTVKADRARTTDIPAYMQTTEKFNPTARLNMYNQYDYDHFGAHIRSAAQALAKFGKVVK